MSFLPKNRVPAVAHTGTHEKTMGCAIFAPAVAHSVAHTSLAEQIHGHGTLGKPGVCQRFAKCVAHGFVTH